MARGCTFGVIIGNRGFFPDSLAGDGWKEAQAVLKAEGHEVVIASQSDTKLGTIESLQDAQVCADLFKKNRDRIDGIVVFLPNFGDEKGVANSIRWSGLNVPVLVQAYPDEPGKMAMGERRDSFCGKISVCNNLRQYGIEFSLTTRHCVGPNEPEFKEDLARFAAVCRVVKGMRGSRFGAIGTRPAAFNTVRYSEKILEANGISVEPMDLAELISACNKAKGSDAAKKKLEELKHYADTSAVTPEGLTRIAALGVALDDFIAKNRLDACAIQCWTAIEELYGVVPCAAMSMLSEKLISQACEVDVTGALAMHSLQLASGTPSALVDWNNNWGNDPDACIVFHCSNFPKSFFRKACLGFQDILAGSVGNDNAWGTCTGVIKPGPVTVARLSTDDQAGELVGYVSSGEILEEDPKTFGGVGILAIPELDDLLNYICENGLEHHVAVNRSEVALAVAEAWERYLGWRVYLHNA